MNFYPAECENVITVGAVKNKLLIINSEETFFDDLMNNYDIYSKKTNDGGMSCEKKQNFQIMVIH